MFDVLFSIWVDRDTLRHAIAYAFDLATEDILVLFDHSALLGLEREYKLIAFIYSTPSSQFPGLATINFDKSALVDPPNFSEIQAYHGYANKLSQVLKCSCVIGDDDQNPYTWILANYGDPPMSIIEVADERADQGDFRIERIVGEYQFE